MNIETLGLGKHALMFSPQTGFSEDEWAKLDEWLDFVYEDFTAKVARGRSMTREAVHELARGRVWTGADAAQRGLVDELGGLRRAVEIARERGRPATRRPPAPGPRGLARTAPASAPQQRRSGGVPASPTLGPELTEWGGHAQLAAALGLPAAGPLTMPIGPLR